MGDYRNLPLEELSVALRTTPSTYGLRLRGQLRAVRTMALWCVGLGNLFFTGGAYLVSFAGAMAGGEGERLALAGDVALVTTGAILGFLLLIALVRAIPRPDAERHLPRALVFTESTVVVTDPDGHASDEGWSTIQEATVSPTQIILVLSREPIHLLYVRPAALGQAKFDLLSGWLRAKSTMTT